MHGPKFSRSRWGRLENKGLAIGAALKNVQYLVFINHRFPPVPPPIVNDRSLTKPTSWLVKFDVLSCYIYLQVNQNKTEICKMAASRFVEVTDKEISEIK
jgi:hypothetical protein